MSQVSEPRSRGVAAIDDHVDRVDRAPEAGRYHPRPSNRFSGAGPVEAVTLHLVEEPLHWHLVTYGLSELHAKESPDPDVSGWGFELTFRVAAEPPAGSPGAAPTAGAPEEGPAEPARPLWAVDFLASLAAYVWSSQHPFAAGHNLDLRGPIRMDSDSAITAAVVVEDAALGALNGPNGRLQFLQVVGLTAAELELCRAWSTDGVVELLRRDDPLLITRLDRDSIDEDPRWADEIERRMKEEGSSLHELRVASLRIKHRVRRGAVVQMGAGAASALGPALRRELVAPGATFTVVGDYADLSFVIDTEPGWTWEGDCLEIAVPLNGVEGVAALFDGKTGWGRLPEWQGLQFRVVK